MTYDRGNTDYYLERAEIYGIMGKEEAALADYRRLMRMEVKDARPWLGRAKYYFPKTGTICH
jgi:Tfp pilus assembly protein PilF